MLLGNADIKTALGKTLRKQIQPRSIQHRGSDSADFVIPSGKIDQCLGKDLGIGQRI